MKTIARSGFSSVSRRARYKSLAAGFAAFAVGLAALSLASTAIAKRFPAYAEHVLLFWYFAASLLGAITGFAAGVVVPRQHSVALNEVGFVATLAVVVLRPFFWNGGRGQIVGLACVWSFCLLLGSLSTLWVQRPGPPASR